MIKITNCPEDVLLNDPCNIKKIKSYDGTKYFACSSMKCVTDSFGTAIKLFSFIVSYREGLTSDISGDVSRDFFGKKTIKKRFCEDGKVWKGPETTIDELVKKELEKDLKKIEEYKRKMQKTIEGYNPKPR